MKLTDIIEIFGVLAKLRKAFWSEADFQFALAWEIKMKFPKAEIRMEKRVSFDVNAYTDIYVKIDGKSYPIELKYKTAKGAYVDSDSSIIQLKQQSAVDLGAYGFLYDIHRIEALAETDKSFERGFVIMLTNDSAYYASSGRNSMYDEFKIYQGQDKTGKLDWKREAYKDKEEPDWLKSYPAIHLIGRYQMNWQPYDEVGDFKYNVVQINAR